MPKRPQELEAGLAALIQEHLLPGERVEHVEISDNKVSVYLIEECLWEATREMLKRFHRGGGMGRILGFEHRDGQWQFTGTGGWIS